MPTLKKICENTSNLNSLNSRPRARLLIRLTSTDLPSDQFSVFLLRVVSKLAKESCQNLQVFCYREFLLVISVHLPGTQSSFVLQELLQDEGRQRDASQ